MPLDREIHETGYVDEKEEEEYQEYRDEQEERSAVFGG